MVCILFDVVISEDLRGILLGDLYWVLIRFDVLRKVGFDFNWGVEIEIGGL